MSKYIDLIAREDTPHLMPPHVSDEEYEDSLPKNEHEREARRTGRPHLGAGAIYPVAEDTFLIDPIAIPEYWGQAFGFDVGWHVTAGIFAAHDPDHDTFYLTSEYYGQQREPLHHATALKMMMPYQLIGAVDPAAEIANQKDGKALKAEYEQYGLQLRLANNAVEAGITHVLTLLQTGRLKVFRTLTNWLREYRLYRKEKSKTSGKLKIVKENDHLMDAMRYVLMTDGVFRKRPVPRVRGPVKYGEW